MPRTPIVRILVEIYIPYDRKVFGAVAAAETRCTEIQRVLETACASGDVILNMFHPSHSTVSLREPTKAQVEPGGDSDSDAPPIPGFLVRK